MEKVLISACLIGDKVKYDGGHNLNKHIQELLEHFELVPFCPEVEGGLKTPRRPSERLKDRVIMNDNKDVTHNFQLGAEKALNICKYLNIKLAILKERSPSCGSKKIHDGSFKERLIDGQGVTTELLRKNGIKVISEEEIEDLLKSFESLQ